MSTNGNGFGGWTGKLLRVDLSSGHWSVEEIPEEWRREYIGGRGLADRYLYEELDPTVDPLSPENKLIFATGPLTGTPVPCGARYTVVDGAAPVATMVGYMVRERETSGKSNDQGPVLLAPGKASAAWRPAAAASPAPVTNQAPAGGCGAGLDDDTGSSDFAPHTCMTLGLLSLYFVRRRRRR